MTSTDSNGWGYRCQIPLTTALAMRGSTDEAAARLGALEKLRHPSWRYLDYEYAIAKAWVAAGQGAVSEAIVISLAAAETARANGQFAPEVMCLQTATQFGERSCGPRLRELAAIVEGPRAGVAARFAEALHDDDGAELAVGVSRIRGYGRSDRCCRCGGARSHRVPAPGLTRVGVGMLGQGRSVGRAMWRRPHANSAQGGRTIAADRPRTRNRDAYRARAVQPGYRDTADVVGSNRRKPHLQSDGQNWHVQPRRARGAVASRRNTGDNGSRQLS